MIIEIVKGCYEKVRFRFLDDGKEVTLLKDDMIEFKSVVKTDNGDMLIDIVTDVVDLDGRVNVFIDTKDMNLISGRYHWELNLIREGEGKTNLLPKERNELIILEKEGDEYD